MDKDKHITLILQQRAKAISTHLSVNLAIHNQNSPMKKAYDNTYHCNRVKAYDGENLTSSYCKNRWCLTCNRIRTAININNYGPQLSQFGQPYFVTLTRPTCTIEELPEQLKHYGDTWRKIYKSSNKKDRKAARLNIYLKGVRSIECTLRPDGKYHLHMHIILDGFANAHWLVSEWLSRNSTSTPSAQDVRSANSGSMVELFKYSVKISKDVLKSPDYTRLDLLFQVLKGKRLMSAFGGLKVTPKEEQDNFDIVAQGNENLQLRFGDEHSIWKWDDLNFDWVNNLTGELLINEPLPSETKALIS